MLLQHHVASLSTGCSITQKNDLLDRHRKLEARISTYEHQILMIMKLNDETLWSTNVGKHQEINSEWLALGEKSLCFHSEVCNANRYLMSDSHIIAHYLLDTLSTHIQYHSTDPYNTYTIYNLADVHWDVLNKIMSSYYLHYYQLFGLNGLQFQYNSLKSTFQEFIPEQSSSPDSALEHIPNVPKQVPLAPEHIPAVSEHIPAPAPPDPPAHHPHQPRLPLPPCAPLSLAIKPTE